MVEYFKAKVEGYKTNKYKDHDFNLDLTYVTDRVIGMSFPGSGLETLYRNNINDVTKLLDKKHGRNYKVINLSEQSYDYKKFNNQVREFPWEDHHSPPVQLLFQICQYVHQFLSEDINNVVAIHCLAGKGRTGTVIACYLLYSGRFSTCEQVLQYYKKKRFAVAGGVGQPSQIRYVEYFEKILRAHVENQVKFDPIVARVESMKMNGVPDFSGGGFKPIIKVFTPRDRNALFNSEQLKQKSYKFDREMHKEVEIVFPQNEAPIVVGDVLVKVTHKSAVLKRDTNAFRFAFNTSMLTFNEDNTAKIKLEINKLDPTKVKEDPRFPVNFSVELELKAVYTKDDLSSSNFLNYNNYNSLYQDDFRYWQLVYHILEDYKKPELSESIKLLFREPENDDVEKVLSNKQSMGFAKGVLLEQRRAISESTVEGFSVDNMQEDRTLSLDCREKSH